MELTIVFEGEAGGKRVYPTTLDDLDKERTLLGRIGARLLRVSRETAIGEACYICDKLFMSWEDWDNRHSFGLEDVHAECCPECN